MTVKKYTVEREGRCNCHPETCCCGDRGWLVMENGKGYVWADTEQKAERIAKALEMAAELEAQS